ncbi:MAG: peptide/nickel transport system permease protein [Thermoleophilaceae bacterium]|nr:peptide/nickel transport system permease protein [Thermoleophilaceae bacterium]
MTAAVGTIDATGIATAQPPASAARLFWMRFKDDKAAFGAVFVIAILILVAIFGGPLAEHFTGHAQNSVHGNMTNDFGVPLGPALHTDEGSFIFGADPAGRDLFVRTMYGARTSLVVGIAATAIAVFVGLTVGLLAGYYGGWIDTLLSRVSDVMLAVPQFIIAIGIVAACSTSVKGCLGGIVQPGINVVIIVIALFTWPYIGRIVRGFTLSLREREFVEASRSLGASNFRIIRKEILPNLIGPIVVYTTLLIPSNIIFEAGLSFLGLGVPADEASWGGLLSDATQYYNVAWWLMVFPGLFLVITTLAFNLLGDGLRDALDVRADR